MMRRMRRVVLVALLVVDRGGQNEEARRGRLEEAAEHPRPAAPPRDSHAIPIVIE